ncbi:2'-5' RNA ligase family protein [Streptomyces tendae]|uniref:2'-5' RNA ligase family protein n=1 Tax=Streptomyces tendae TaxID=1932 RepID=UPI00371331D4
MPSPPPRKPPRRHGTVRAIFAVTGVVDEVNDLILPGAFTRTLATRRVKSVFHHEWKDPVGVVLEVEEWKPGDPRFATIPDGAVWPKEAGALVATVQFNMRTQRGRDVYEQVRQWHEHGEAQFSIGYKVPPGAASKRHDGVRIIHSLDLYEVSPVLHGAHPMTRSLEVKSAAYGEGVEHKATWSAIELDRKDAEQQVDRGVMIALPIQRDVAERIAQPEGTAPRDLHITLAYLGDAAALGGHPDDLVDLVRSALTDANPLEGSVGGIGRFPDSGDGEVTWVPVDVAGLTELRTRIAEALRLSVYADKFREDHGFTPHVTLGYRLPGVAPFPQIPVRFDEVLVVQGPKRTPIPLSGPPVDADTVQASMEAKTAAAVRLEAKSAGDPDRGNAEHLRDWYAHGEGAARIGWGSSGDFDRCVALASKHMSPDDAKGYCNLRHHDALGIYPATHAAESKSAHAAVLEAKTLPLETPMPAPTPYSYEQLRNRIAEAARPLFDCGEDGFTSVEATYPDRAIIVVCKRGENSTYAVPYTVNGFDVDLGTPQPVELATVAVPVDGKERAASADEEIDARFLKPSAQALDDATALITVSDATPDEVGTLQPSVERLLAALAKKGAPAPTTKQPVPPGGDEVLDDEADDDYLPDEQAPAEADEELELENGTDDEPTSTPPVDLWDDDEESEQWGTDDEGDDEPYTPLSSTDRAVLDKDEVKAQLDALRI